MNAPTRYTIGQLARECGLPTTTIRFYERQRLIAPEARSRGNYRLYGAETIDRLRFIRAAKDAGFTIENIRLLLAMKDETSPPSQEVESLVEQRLSSVKHQLHHLREIERLLKDWLAICREAQKCGRCGVLDELEAAAHRQDSGKQKE